MGRCNAEGTSVLYVSEELKIPFEELTIQPNEQFYAIRYKTKVLKSIWHKAESKYP